MFDDAERAVAFDFEEFSGFLNDQGADASAARVHGCLSGLLAAGGDRAAEHGLYAMSQALDLSPHGELASLVMQLYTATAGALADDDFAFHPLLPGDETDIELRVTALADWCSGFLAGVAQATSAAGGEDWSADGREILQDMAAFAQAGVGERETEEESESSYLELVEYLRYAVLNLAMERGPGGDGPGDQPGLQSGAGVTLH